MKPFLLIQSRPEDETSDNEYQAFLRYSKLTEDQLIRLRLDQTELPALDIDEYSGIFVGGSPFTSTTPDKSPLQQRIEQEMKGLMQRVFESDFPFLGACYGIGLLATNLGGTMSERYSEPVGPMEIELLESDPILEGLPSNFVSFLGHKEACDVPPPGSIILAKSASCPIQMLKIKNNIYATQFHPELDFEGLRTRINIYKYHGYFKPEEAELIIQSNSSVAVTEPMKIIKNFIKKYYTSN